MRGGTGEGPAVGEEDLRQVQGDPPARPGHGHLRQRPAQAAPGLREYLNMARLAGVDLPREKRMEIALTYIYGIGKHHAQETLAATGVSPDLRVKDLGDEDLLKLRDYIDEHFRVEGDLRREVAGDIRRKIEIGSYQGLRHRRGLPVHGQRTRTNARSSKGPRKTIAGKKKAGKKKPGPPRRGARWGGSDGAPFLLAV